MTEDTRSLGLLTQIVHGLLACGQARTQDSLGDRKTYVGLSDVGRALTCLRAAVADKLGLAAHPKPDDLKQWFKNGEATRITETLSRQLILQRGHWLEAGLEASLHANGSMVIPQLEIIDIRPDVPLKAHLDFTMIRDGRQPAVRVVELKSTGHLPDTLHPGYEAQLYGQIGLLSALWDQPAFRISKMKPQSFPNLCRQLFGVELPLSSQDIDIEGWVLCLSMSEAKTFGPYRPNATMLNLCRRTAASLWNTAQAVASGQAELNDSPYCQGFHPLCDWCDHARDCPKFRAETVNDPILNEQLAQLAELKSDRTRIESEIQIREDQIRQFYSRVGNPTAWLSTGHFRFKTCPIAGRKTIDSARLRATLTNRLGEVEAENLLAEVTTTGDGYERLTISPIKP